MARTKEVPCLFYICVGECKKDRDAEHYGYCQRCNLYEPRVKKKRVNNKKRKLEILKKEDVD